MRAPFLTLLLLFEGIISQEQDFSQCGQNIDLASVRISIPGLADTDPLGTWPWMASLGYYEANTWLHLCGSVIVSRKHVLTAAHCVTIDRILQLRMGDKDLTDIGDDFGANLRSIHKITIHPKYDRRNSIAYYDIAVLEATPEITFSGFIRPICLPPVTTNLDEFAGQLVTVSGWGFQTRNSPGTSSLKSVPIRIYSQSACNATHSRDIPAAQKLNIQSHLPQLFTLNIMCAGYERPLFGPCKGDSGSPLVWFQHTGTQSQYVLRGLVQGGVGDCGDKDFPAIFTRIDAPEIHEFITSATDVSTETSQLENSAGREGVTSEEFLSFILHSSNPDGFNKTNLSLRSEDSKGNSLLLYFTSQNNRRAVETLLENGANVQHVNDNGENALLVAAKRNGTEGVVDLLLKHGISPFQHDKEGSNALHLSAITGNLPVASILVNKGVDVNSLNNVWKMPLHFAVQYGHYDTAKYLIEQGADMQARTKNHRNYPIHYLVRTRWGGTLVQLLLHYGADIESKDKDGLTAMFSTFYYGHMNPTIELYKAGASLDIKTSYGATVLHSAAHHNRVGHIRWLGRLENGNYIRRLINQSDDYGRTPLMYAAHNHHLSALKELLSLGADKQMEDLEGRRALDWAKENKKSNNDPEVVTLLS